MAYAESVLDLIGNTPLVRLRTGRRRARGLVLAKVEYLNPGGSVKDRIALRMVDAAEASGGCGRAGRSSSRPAATPGSAWRSSPSTRATGASSSSPTRCRATRSRCSRPTAPRWWCAPPRSTRSHPDSYYSVSDRLVRRSRGPGSPTSTRTRRTRVARRGHRARDLGADRGPGHPLRGRHRHRRHDHRRRPLPQGGQRRPGAGHRGRPRGLGVLRRQRPAVPGRGRGRGLLAHHLRPDGPRPGDRGLARTASR